MREEVYKDGERSRLSVLTFLCVFFIMAIEGIDLSTLAVSLTVIMEDFSLDPVQGGMIFSISTAGMMAGGILCGSLADRYGRLRMTQISTMLFTIFICLSTIVDNFLIFCIIRFISSAGMAGAWSSGVVMVSEFMPTEKRNTALGLIQGANPFGAAAATVMNGMITPAYGWRPVVLTAAACGLLALLLSRRLQEPSGFQAYQKRQKDEKKKKESAVGIRLLFTDRVCRSNLIKWAAGSVFLMGGYYAANSWLPTYLTDAFGVSFQTMSWFIAGTYVMMFFGRMMTGVLSDRFGRKRIWFITCFGTAALLPVIITMASANNVGYLVLLFGLFYGAPMALCSTFMSEFFPLECRGTGTSIAYNSGRIGSMISTVMIGAFVSSSHSYNTGFFMIALFYLLCGILVFFMQEKQFDPSGEEG